jgi:hypothetical protein
MRAALGTTLARITTTLALVATASCMREGAPPVAPVESTSDSLDGGAAVPLVITAPPPSSQRGERCTALLKPSTIKTGSGCTLDEQISHSNGTLLYPCSGDGTVEAVFGEHRFQGNITGSSLLLALTTELDWQDNCHWQTKQTIRGEWRREGKHPKLSWSYAEAPLTGPGQSSSTAGCYGSCKATADIAVDEVNQ